MKLLVAKEIYILEKNFEEQIDLAAKRLVELRDSPEGQEGLSSFLEKRKPKW